MVGDVGAFVEIVGRTMLEVVKGVINGKEVVLHEAVTVLEG